jgi:hypothetical protein
VSESGKVEMGEEKENLSLESGIVQVCSFSDFRLSCCMPKEKLNYSLLEIYQACEVAEYSSKNFLHKRARILILKYVR